VLVTNEGWFRSSHLVYMPGMAGVHRIAMQFREEAAADRI
jgi:hypothetical protein